MIKFKCIPTGIQLRSCYPRAELDSTWSVHDLKMIFSTCSRQLDWRGRTWEHCQYSVLTSDDRSVMEPSESKRKRFSRLSEEEIQNLIEGKNSENTREATKNAVVTFLAYWNEVKPENEKAKNTKSLENFRRRNWMNFWRISGPTQRNRTETSTKSLLWWEYDLVFKYSFY